MDDISKFKSALVEYLDGMNKRTEEKKKKVFEQFYSQIKDLDCNDFRLFYYRAFYLNNQNQIEEAMRNIEKSIKLIGSIGSSDRFGEENDILVSVPVEKTSDDQFVLNLPSIKEQISAVYFCAGEIYAKNGNMEKAIEYHKKREYYASFLKSEFDENCQSVRLFSFRNYNQYTLADLVNNELTVCPSRKMNDPFDSLINVWGDYWEGKGLKNMNAMRKSFENYRIRSFCYSKGGKGNSPIRNILMWSHYAGEHTGFCIKYKLSKYFIKQDTYTPYKHMYLKKIEYTNKKINIKESSIESGLAFATKQKCWAYENEVRLIVYDAENEIPFYGIKLDEDSEIEAIFFGYRCEESTINVIKNLFARKGEKTPKFYKMKLNEENVYKLQYDAI